MTPLRLAACCVAFALACGGGEAQPASRAPERSPEGNQTLDEVKLIDYTERGVRAKLKDPESATFKNVRVFYGSGNRVVCGEVNSKNSFGGKSGFQRFVGVGSTTFLAEEIAGGIGESWARFCK